MHIVWVYIITVVGFASLISFYAFINNIDQKLIFYNKIWLLAFFVGPLVYIYKIIQYPNSGYEMVIRLAPMSAGLGMLVVSIPLLTNWFKWDPKYKNVLPTIEKIHNNRKAQFSFFYTGLSLVSIQLFLDFFIR